MKKKVFLINCSELTYKLNEMGTVGGVSLKGLYKCARESGLAFDDRSSPVVVCMRKFIPYVSQNKVDYVIVCTIVYRKHFLFLQL